MYSCITITGRRVEVKPMGASHTKLVLSGRKSLEASFASTKSLLGTLVEPALPYDELTISEETDLLYLVRLMGLRNLMPFTHKCQNPTCKLEKDYQIDIRRMRRTLIQCSDPQCPCHDKKLSEYDMEELLESTDPRATVDWSAIPEDHLKTAPPDLTHTLEESGKVFECRQILAKDKSKLGAWMENDDIDTIVKTLGLMVVDVDNKGINNIKDPKKRERAIHDEVNSLSAFDLFQLRDQVESRDGGIDNEIKIKCSKCEQVATATVTMNSSFFLPRRATLSHHSPS